MSEANDYPETRAKPSLPEAPTDAFDSAIPKAPKHLDRAAKKIFEEMAHELSVAGVLRTADRWILAQCAQAASDVIRLTREVRREGVVKTGPNGGDVCNMKVGILRDREKRLQDLCDRMGLSPRARAALEFPDGVVPTETGAGDDSPQDQMEFWIEEARDEQRKRAQALVAKETEAQAATEDTGT